MNIPFSDSPRSNSLTRYQKPFECKNLLNFIASLRNYTTAVKQMMICSPLKSTSNNGIIIRLIVKSYLKLTRTANIGVTPELFTTQLQHVHKKIIPTELARQSQTG